MSKEAVLGRGKGKEFIQPTGGGVEQEEGLGCSPE